MTTFYPETRWHVYTQDEDEKYTVERGSFTTREGALTLKNELVEIEGVPVQIIKRYWREMSEPDGWYSAKNSNGGKKPA